MGKVGTVAEVFARGGEWMVLGLSRWMDRLPLPKQYYKNQKMTLQITTPSKHIA